MKTGWVQERKIRSRGRKNSREKVGEETEKISGEIFVFFSFSAFSLSPPFLSLPLSLSSTTLSLFLSEWRVKRRGEIWKRKNRSRKREHLRGRKIQERMYFSLSLHFLFLAPHLSPSSSPSLYLSISPFLSLPPHLSSLFLYEKSGNHHIFLRELSV